MAIIRFRRDTQARWNLVNPVLSSGEPGFETDTGRVKMGDGETAWQDLQYFIPKLTFDATIDELNSLFSDHINSDSPHPVYDDGPSLVLLYENAKV
jgi:hypothetical protein